jgi:hypothetical protein
VVFNDRLGIFYYFLTCLDLIKTLFSARIQGLFGSKFGFTSKGFGSVFVYGSKTEAHKCRSIRVNFSKLFKH